MSFARYALFLWGALLPFVSFSVEKGGAAKDLASRFTAADVFGLLAILFSLPAGRWLKPNSFFPAMTGGALLLVAAASSFFAILLSSSGEPLSRLMTPWLIFAFLMILSARASVLLRSERDIAILMTCVAVGACLESFIVGHDLLSRLWGGAMWFRDPMDLRMRGTFRASGQLAQYGFVVGTVLFALSAWPGKICARTRLWWSMTAVFLMLYPVFTTRRSGIGAFAVLILIWIVLSQVYGSPDARKVLPVLVPAALFLCIYLAQAEYRDFLFGRVARAQQGVATGQSFLFIQLQDAKESIPQNPVFGVGWGLSKSESSTGNEMHNAYLAVLVDSGLVGAFAFGAFILSLVFGSWKLVRMTRHTPYFETALRFFAALTAQLVFWIHNRGLRDRGFFLFLAVFAACAHHIKTRRSEAHAR
jgi:O-antigen ligase